jgi:hypothetical protein
MTGMVAEQHKGEMYLVGYTQAQEAVSLFVMPVNEDPKATWRKQSL